MTMKIDLGVFRNPEAAMSPHQIKNIRNLDDPALSCVGNTKTLAQYLEEDTKQVATAGAIEHRNSSNCHYIIDHARREVFFAYGFHGTNVFNALVNGNEDDIWFRV